MKRKRWGIWTVCVLIAVLMIAGMYAIAVEYGSQNDPLITLSYISDVVLPEARGDAESKITAAMADYDQALSREKSAMEAYIDQQLRSYASGRVDSNLVDEIAAAVLAQTGGASSSGGAQWSTVAIPAGKKVTCDLGCQIILRIGGATCVASGTPGLIDLSDAATLENGKALIANHLYQVSVQGRGFQTANGCTVLISGGYTVQ